MQNGPIGKSQSVAQRPQVERLRLWVTSVDLRTPAPRQPITQNRKVAGKKADVDQNHLRRCSIGVLEPKWVDLSQTSPLCAQYDE